MSKKFYVERGLAVGKSFGSYVDFATPSSPIGLGLYKRRALAKRRGRRRATVAPDPARHRRRIVHRPEVRLGARGRVTPPRGGLFVVIEARG